MQQLLRTRGEAYASLALLAATMVIILAVSSGVPVFNKDNNVAGLSEASSSSTNTNKQTLSNSDKRAYSTAFRLQKEAKWQEADNIIANIDNRLLMGHLLAQRYLHHNYKSSKQELSDWLTNYSNLSEARRIYNIAISKGVKADMPKSARRNLKGYGESFKSSRNESPRIAGSWKSGLSYWKSGKYEKSYRIFSSLENRTQTMGDWDRAAISFWAYRAADKLGKTEQAKAHLKLATRFPRSFYGAQAVHLLGNTLNKAVALRGEKNLEGYLAKIKSKETRNALRRIDALIAIEQTNMARNELVVQYSKAKAADRVAFIHLAQKLDMPATQLRMGVDMERKGITSGKALYPLPKWQPKDGYVVDPALIFAIARQESGFNTKAKSYSGARGMMQLMPETAKYIAKKVKAGKNIRLNDPETNVNLGQNYLRYLANKPYIKGNVVLLAAAYNAGPGNAKRWASRASMAADPLYFVETIPFSETRNYVMNVMVNYWMYREIMNDGDPGVTLLSEGKWPTTLPRSNKEVATTTLSWPNA